MLIDIYALSPERSVAAVERFLARFLPHREPTAVDYPVPAYSDTPSGVFGTPEELIAFCCEHPEMEQRVYWLNRVSGDPHSAHVFFLPDRGLVFGLSVADQDESAWDRWLEELKLNTGTAYGYWTSECPPEDTLADFIAMASNTVHQK